MRKEGWGCEGGGGGGRGKKNVRFKAKWTVKLHGNVAMYQKEPEEQAETPDFSSKWGLNCRIIGWRTCQDKCTKLQDGDKCT